MPNWEAITTANLANSKVAALVTALRTSALGSGQTDRSTEIITGVVNRVRRKIASNPRNRVDSDETKVPVGLKDDAIKLIIADLKNALEMALSDDEAAEVRRINGDLNRIANGDDTVDSPDDAAAAEVERGTGISQVGTTTRKATRTTMQGL